MSRLKGSMLKGSKTIAAAALAGVLGVMAMGVSAAQADPWHGGGYGHDNGWHHGHNGWNRGPTVVVRNGYYYAPPPPVYYAPAPVYVAPPPPPPVVYQPAPVYVAPPLLSLQFRL